MKRKVFISVLGTGFYNEASYTSGTFASTLTRFAQIATLEYINAQEWDPSSVGYILLTEKAACTNWNKSIQDRFNGKAQEIQPYLGLEAEIENDHYPFKIEGLPIPDGNNKEEMFAIFQTLFNLLRPGDELYFDMTHGFRYLPMLALVLGNYAKFLLNAKIMHMSYCNVEKDIAEIMDLLPLNELMDWTDAVEHLTFSGNASKILQLSKRQDPLTDVGVSRPKQKTPAQLALQHFVTPLNALTLDLKTCQGWSLIEGKAIKVTKDSLKEDRSLLPEPFLPVLDKVEEMFHDFSDSFDWKNGIRSARWCFGHQQYQQAVTLLQESIVTIFCFVFQLEWTDKKHREDSAKKIISSINAYKGVLHLHDDLPDDEVRRAFEEIDSDYRQSRQLKEQSKFVISHPYLFRMCSVFSSITNVRNKYNHGGMLKDRQTAFSMIETIDKQLARLEEMLCVEELASFNPSHADAPLFVNLSNHPSSSWSEKQLLAAKTYGEIVDIPFPEVPVDGNIPLLTEQVLRQVNSVTNGNISCVIHVMGEMTLTYELVSSLAKIGYMCLASVTERKVQYQPNGSKNSIFEFEGFRPYIGMRRS